MTEIFKNLAFCALSYIFVILICVSCYDLDYVDNTKYKVSGTLKNIDNQPISNYKIIIKVAKDFNANDSIFASSPYDSFINEAITDSEGKFQVYFPKTNGKEYLTTENLHLFEYQVNNVIVHKDFYQLNFRDFQQNIDNLKLIIP